MDFTTEIREPKRALTIVVVDDDQDISKLFTVTLEAYGHQVHAFGNAEAVWLFRDLAKVDVFLVDFGLPGMDGATLVQHLRQRVGRAPIGMVSGHPIGSPQHHLALGAGVDFYVTKPVDLRALVSTVCQLE